MNLPFLPEILQWSVQTVIPLQSCPDGVSVDILLITRATVHIHLMHFSSEVQVRCLEIWVILFYFTNVIEEAYILHEDGVLVFQEYVSSIYNQLFLRMMTVVSC